MRGSAAAWQKCCTMAMGNDAVQRRTKPSHACPGNVAGSSYAPACTPTHPFLWGPWLPAHLVIGNAVLPTTSMAALRRHSTWHVGTHSGNLHSTSPQPPPLTLPVLLPLPPPASCWRAVTRARTPLALRWGRATSWETACSRCGHGGSGKWGGSRSGTSGPPHTLAGPQWQTCVALRTAAAHPWAQQAACMHLGLCLLLWHGARGVCKCCQLLPACPHAALNWRSCGQHLAFIWPSSGCHPAAGV